MTKRTVFSIESVQFPGVFLRMDGAGVTKPVAPGGGIVNCQFNAGPYEKFTAVPNADGSTSIQSVQFQNVFLRIDGTGVTKPVAPGGGIVNCQFNAGPYEKYRLAAHNDASVSFESVQFPGVFLRMDGAGVTKPVAPGGGIVNCQFNAGPYEKFWIIWQ
jgi:hypothetical protein